MDIIFKRKIEKTIEDYFNNPDSPILIIDGARQIGKTFVIRKLGKKHFKNYVEINMIEDKTNNRLFENVKNTKEFYFAIQSYHGKKIGDGENTLIFIDEIQEYPELFTLLKFINEEKKYRFIASGSLLGVTLKKTSSIPIGSISVKRMYPMNFEEFLWANDFDEDFIKELRDSVFKNKEVPLGIHNRILALFKDYLISGGLPQCVNLFLAKQDLISLRDTQKEIFEYYGDDATKYDLKNKLHTKAILDLIPSNIENKRKRIYFKDIEGIEKARFEKYQEDFDVLVASGVALETNCSSIPSFRLLESEKRNLVKLYLADIGVLTSLLYKYNVKAIIDDIPHINLGNVYETAIAIELKSKGYDLFYSDNKKLGEIDFLIDDYDSLSVVAIEVKSGKDYKKHNALDLHLQENKEISKAIVLSNSNKIEENGKILYAPIYSVMFL